MDLVSCIGSGPYSMAPGDTLHFVTAFIAAIDAAGMDVITKNAWDLYHANFSTPKPPTTPTVKVVSGDGRATITWDNAAESSRDPITHEANFEGYRIYKSVDFGLHWDQIDRNANPSAGVDPVPLASFDESTGIQNSFVDSSLINGFTYWYSVTAYAFTSDETILESSLGHSSEEQNVGVATPESRAVGRTPARVSTITHSGRRRSPWTSRSSTFPEPAARAIRSDSSPPLPLPRGICSRSSV